MFLNTNISQGSVAKRLELLYNLNDHFIAKFTAECASTKIMKISWCLIVLKMVVDICR